MKFINTICCVEQFNPQKEFRSILRKSLLDYYLLDVKKNANKIKSLIKKI